MNENVAVPGLKSADEGTPGNPRHDAEAVNSVAVGGKELCSCWGGPTPRMYSADWLVVLCNNPHCGAMAIISKEDMLGLLPPAPQSKPLGVAP